MRWAATGALALLALGAVVGFEVYPTQPNYDSMWSLVWARELLAGQAPSLDAYRAPTQHPLALAAATALVALGAVPHAFVALTLASFVALVAGLARLGAATLGVLTGVVAALLLLTRLNFAFLAAFAYIDVAFLALLIWAGVLVARDAQAGRARRPAVWILLVAAGLLRPEGWAFALMYAAWGWRGATRGQRCGALAAAATAPLLWALTDLALTGDPLFTWTYTTGSAADFGRDRSLLDLPRATLRSAEEFVKAPVLALAAVGIALALWRRPRGAVVPLAITGGGVATFLLISQQGFSVIPRYFAIAAVGLFLFAGFALAGWELLARGSRIRRGWATASAIVALAGGAFVAATLNPAKVDAELRLRERVFADLERLLASPQVRAAGRCGPISLPNHKLVPFVIWRTHAASGDVIARSDVRALPRARRGGVAVVVRDIPGIRSHPAFGPRGDVDAVSVIPAPAGFRLAVSTRALTAWTRCPSPLS